MSSLKLLHLSDFHFGNFRHDEPTNLAVKISDVLYDQSKKVDVVVVSGDIFDGSVDLSPGLLDFAILFFDTLIKQLIQKEIVVDAFSRDDILFVPGNHDLIRKKDNEFKKYDSFIKQFYPKGTKGYCTFTDKYNFYYKHPDKKVIILEFNSCKIEVEKIKDDELKWIEKIDLSEFSERDLIKEKIKSFKVKEKETWDDYGYLAPLEVDNLFIKLKLDVTNLNEYTIVCVFHHHFYPFPEIIKKLGDTSLIRNYSVVVDKFQREKVSIVLHGHKHLPIQRIVTDNKYFDNPDSVIYVLAAGSIGNKNVYNPSFQWLRIFDKNEQKIADGERYEFNDEELNNVRPFSLPPQKKDEQTVGIRLIEILQNEQYSLYKTYIGITDDFEQVIQDNGIDKIIDTIGSLITMFKDIKLELQRDPKLIFALLLAINYRVIFLNKIRNDQNTERLEELLNKIRNAYKENISNSEYFGNLISFLSAPKNKDLDEAYDLIMKNVKTSDKRISAYVSICVFFTDLFLNISKYGEYYFEKEGLKHKINISLEKELFYNNIPNQSISIIGNVDRRAILFNFKCKNPTVHKIAVLIVKDFEIRLSKFEESLREINLKLYYIIPRVTPDKYDLENFHFDAYIPTLLPLLTGDNLYQQKEVFIRELVQNSIDAILLRKKLNPDDIFSTDIVIELGSVRKNSKNVKYFKIIDEGIGMSKFTIERYFTSIGRSFYVSDEFDELKKSNNIKYQAISNFGIGFLSSFMVCKEILVRTKSIMGDGSLEIEIPNYDGCFFIRNIDKENYGTEITLYSDDRNLFDFKKFLSYIRETFLNLELKIRVVDTNPTLDSFEIPAYSKQKVLSKKLVNSKEILFFIPFNEDGIKNISWINDFYAAKGITHDPFGIYFNFSNIYESVNGGTTTLNQGLKISKPFLPFKLKESDFFPETLINYPSSFIQLDVAREKVNLFKKSKEIGPKVFETLKFQVEEFLTTENIIREESSPMLINRIGYFFSRNNLEINDKFYSLHIKINRQKRLKIKLIQNHLIPVDYDLKSEAYFNYFSLSHLEKFIKFLYGISNKSKSDIKEVSVTKQKIKYDIDIYPMFDIMSSHRYFYKTKFTDYDYIDPTPYNRIGAELKIENTKMHSQGYLFDHALGLQQQILHFNDLRRMIKIDLHELNDDLINQFYSQLLESYSVKKSKRRTSFKEENPYKDYLFSSLINLSFYLVSSFSVKSFKNKELSLKLLTVMFLAYFRMLP